MGAQLSGKTIRYESQGNLDCCLVEELVPKILKHKLELEIGIYNYILLTHRSQNLK